MKLAVIGPPGHGNSTFLNALAGDDVFETGSTADSGTQEVQSKVIILKQKDEEGQEHELHLTVVDTMGFPDTDPEKAQDYYDKVVSACNEPLNAIILVTLVVKPERATHDLLHKYRVLLREFNSAQPPLILVVNSTENYSQDAFLLRQEKKKKEKHARDHSEFATRIVGECHIAVSKTLISTEKPDLRSEVKEQLFMALVGTVPKRSNMKTSQQLPDEFEAARQKGEAGQLEEQKMKEEEDKQKRNIEQLERALEWWENCRRWGWVPYIGRILEKAATARINFLKQELEQKKAERKQLVWKNESIRSDVKTLMQEIQSAWALQSLERPVQVASMVESGMQKEDP